MPDKQRLKFSATEFALFGAPLLVVVFLWGINRAKRSVPAIPSPPPAPRAPLPPAPAPPRPTIYSVAFSPDGTRFASGDGSGNAKVWGTKSGDLLGVFRGNGSEMKAVAFSANGRLLAGAVGQSLYLWNLQQGLLARVLKVAPKNISSISFSPDGRLVAVSTHNSTLFNKKGSVIYVWRVATGKPEAVLDGGATYIGSAAFSPDSQFIVESIGVNAQALVRLWSLKTKKLVWSVSGYTPQADVAFSRDGKRVAYGGFAPRILSARDGQPTPAFPMVTGEGLPYRIAFSSNGRFLASGGYGNSILFWDTATGKQLDPQLSLAHYDVNSLAFSRDGQYLVSGNGLLKGTVKVWDTSRLSQTRNASQPLTASDVPLLLAVDVASGQVVRGTQASTPMWARQ